MTIQVGERMPAGELAHMGPEGIETITAEELFGGNTQSGADLGNRLHGRLAGDLNVGFHHACRVHSY